MGGTDFFIVLKIFSDMHFFPVKQSMCEHDLSITDE